MLLTYLSSLHCKQNCFILDLKLIESLVLKMYFKKSKLLTLIELNILEKLQEKQEKNVFLFQFITYRDCKKTKLRWWWNVSRILSDCSELRVPPFISPPRDKLSLLNKIAQHVAAGFFCFHVLLHKVLFIELINQ